MMMMQMITPTVYPFQERAIAMSRVHQFHKSCEIKPCLARWVHPIKCIPGREMTRVEGRVWEL